MGALGKYVNVHSQCNKTPRAEQYQFLMSWPKLALPSMTAVVRKAVLPVKSSPPAVTTCAARERSSDGSAYTAFFVHPYRYLRALINKDTSVERIRARKEQVHCCSHRKRHVIIPS